MDLRFPMKKKFGSQFLGLLDVKKDTSLIVFGKHCICGPKKRQEYEKNPMIMFLL